MIELRNVYKSFDGNTVLKDFSLFMEKGERVCLMGRSGCGKSTVINLLLGLLSADSGSVLTEGNVSAVFQEDRLCEDFSAKSNVKMVCDDEQKAAEILSMLGLFEESAKPVREFSGGMKRRTAIARALLFPHDILLLDEPFTGLDDQSRRAAAECINLLSEGKTILLVSHDEEDADLLNAKIIKL